MFDLSYIVEEKSIPPQGCSTDWCKFCDDTSCIWYEETKEEEEDESKNKTRMGNGVE